MTCIAGTPLVEVVPPKYFARPSRIDSNYISSDGRVLWTVVERDRIRRQVERWWRFSKFLRSRMYLLCHVIWRCRAADGHGEVLWMAVVVALLVRRV